MAENAWHVIHEETILRYFAAVHDGQTPAAALAALRAEADTTEDHTGPPTRGEATVALHEALDTTITVYDEDGRNGCHLGDWIALYCLEPLDPDLDQAIYGTCMAGGRLSSHRALGLLNLAAHQFTHVGWET